MAQEIERKFLVKGNYKQEAFKSIKVVQGYLSSVPERTVRVRVKGEKGFLTIKGLGSASGASRYEWEKEIPVEEAHELLELCEAGIIEKTRSLVQAGHHVYEVDEFYGENTGLVLAEIELDYEEEPFIKPNWLGAEVTGKPQYFNSMLAKHPFKDWKLGK